MQWMKELTEAQPTLTEADWDDALKVALAAVEHHLVTPHDLATEAKLYRVARALRQRLGIKQMSSSTSRTGWAGTASSARKPGTDLPKPIQQAAPPAV